MLDLILRHYGVDWLAMVLTFVSLVRLGDHKRDGFIWGFLSTVAWAVFNVLVFSVAGVIANIVFFYLNLRGWLRWNRRAEARAKEVSSS